MLGTTVKKQTTTLHRLVYTGNFIEQQKKRHVVPMNRPTKTNRKKSPRRKRKQLDGAILFNLVREGHVAPVRTLLMEATDNVQISQPYDDLNNTSLHHAAKTGNISVLRVLLSFGAQTNVQNALGETPLLLSWHSWCNTDKNSLFCPPAKISVESIVELLLQYGADTNIASKTGERPLHLAARFGHPKLCQRLLNFRANPHQKSSGKDGITPINLAKKVNTKEYNECVQVMDRWTPDNHDHDPNELAKKSVFDAFSNRKKTVGGWRNKSKGKSTSTPSLKRQQQQLLLLESSTSLNKEGLNRFNPRKRLGPLRRVVPLPDSHRTTTTTSSFHIVHHDIQVPLPTSPAFGTELMEKKIPAIIIRRFEFDQKLMDSLSCRWQGTKLHHPTTR